MLYKLSTKTRTVCPIYPKRREKMTQQKVQLSLKLCVYQKALFCCQRLNYVFFQGQFRGRTEIAPDQREKFLQRLQQVQQQGHSNLLGMPLGGNKQFSSQQNPLLQQVPFCARYFQSFAQLSLTQSTYGKIDCQQHYQIVNFVTLIWVFDSYLCKQLVHFMHVISHCELL